MSFADYYEPKTLRGVIKKTLPLRTFFKTRFFGNAVTFPTETVSFEFQDGARKLAPYVNPRIGSESMAREGYVVKDFRPPLVAPSRPITNDTLAQKLLGEQPYNSGVTPEERAESIVAQDMVDLQDAIWRREEFMCARAKQDGKLVIKGRAVNAVVDYGFDGITTVGSGDRWTSDFDIVGQLSVLAEDLQKDGVNPDMLIMGNTAAKALLANAKVAALLDNKRIDIGEIRPAQLENGVNYVGRIASPGVNLDLYTYSEWYEDDTGKVSPIIDPETVIIQSSNERNSMLYGAITLMNAQGDFETHMEAYTPNSWFTQNPPQRFLSLSSRPLPMPHDLKSWRVLKQVVSGS